MLEEEEWREFHGFQVKLTQYKEVMCNKFRGMNAKSIHWDYTGEREELKKNPDFEDTLLQELIQS